MSQHKTNTSEKTRTIFSHYDGVYGVNDIDMICERIKDSQVIRTNKRTEVFNIPCAFDIETSSFYEGEEKRAIMYEWTLGLNGYVIIGRTWYEFLHCIDVICVVLDLNPNRRLIVYVHNLAFEFQFFRKWFKWKQVFAINDRKPVYAVTVNGIEFRCSYILSGYALETLGQQIRKYPVEKMVGDLDYSKIRHSGTLLTAKETKYCENDVRVVMSYIQETIERDGDIKKIPLTKTGYVRNYCRNACMYEKGGHKKNPYKFLKYRRLMDSLVLDPDEYRQLERAFQGGFTHANAFYSGQVMYDVASYDFTSSYPTVMIAEQFPMSRGEIIDIRSRAEFERNLLYYCCLFDIEFIGLEAITMFEHPLSKSRCWACVGVTEDNGRIVEAASLKTTLTEQDYFILKKFYKWDQIKIGTFRRYKRGYLPTDFIKSILTLYINKTELKGVKSTPEHDYETDYLQSKERINACYGMCVTAICRDEVKYSGTEWMPPQAGDVVKAIDKENKNIRRFLYYPWGIWVTAYARRNLFSGIYEFKNDYVYSDTDSIKAINAEKHADYINRYNERITQKLEKALKWHHIPVDMIRPLTVKGVPKPLGVWDYEGTYSRFKTLGAKRYMTEKDGEVSITVSGVNKKYAVPYLTETYGDGVFDAFTDGLRIPPEYTGKMTHTYLDDEQTGVIIDYTGMAAEYYEKSSVHLENADYSLSLASAYVDYLMGIREESK